MNASGDNSLREVSDLADKQVRLEAIVARLEEELKEARTKLQSVSEVSLPRLMGELGLSEFKTDRGFKVSLRENVRVSVKADGRDRAAAFVEEAGAPSLVKRLFTIRFGREDEAWANKFAADLRKRKKPLDFVVERKVEPATLTSWVKNRLRSGDTVPEDIFSVFQQRISQVEMPKESPASVGSPSGQPDRASAEARHNDRRTTEPEEW